MVRCSWISLVDHPHICYNLVTTFWLFQGANITLHGGGTIDGNGQVWWDAFAIDENGGVSVCHLSSIVYALSCCAYNVMLQIPAGSSRGFSRPIPLTIANAKNVLIQSIKVVQSPNWHNFVYQVLSGAQFLSATMLMLHDPSSLQTWRTTTFWYILIHTTHLLQLPTPTVGISTEAIMSLSRIQSLKMMMIA